MATQVLDNFSESDSENHRDFQTEIPNLKPINFEKYVQNNCHNKIKILQRSTIHEIVKPMLIFFNHFREKCAYHTKSLDKLYQLSLKYGDRIEFIAGDLFDIDLLKYKQISIEYFYGDVNPKLRDTVIFAIDEKKRIHEQNYTEDQSLKNLKELCEKLLKDKLFKSQPLPVYNNTRIVKICVHDNYKELITDSKKHILLIIHHTDYAQLKMEDQRKYENVGKMLYWDNVELVYINGDKNYIPYELGITCYTTLVFIPQNDKNNFVCHPTLGSETEENIITSIRSLLKDREKFLKLKNKDLSKNWYVPLDINNNLNMDFTQLPKYLNEHCHQYLKMFNRQHFKQISENIIIAFLDFSRGKCSSHHLKIIDQIYQVAINLHEKRHYFIADFKDIDIINSQWKREDFVQNVFDENLKCKIFGIDCNKQKFMLRDFKNAASIFYFAYSLSEGELVKDDMIC